MKYLLDMDPRIKVPKLEEFLDVPTYINFTGTFSEESAKKFRDELEAAEAHCTKSKQDIIPVVIDSYGGSVYALLSMIDTIENCEVTVATIVESKAMSCGAVLFSCGAEGHRYIGPNATVLIHDVSSFSHGKDPEIQASAEETKRLNTLIYEKMASNCGHKDAKYFYDIVTERRGADWFLTSKDCVKHQLANHVRIPQMEVSVKMDWKFE